MRLDPYYTWTPERQEKFDARLAANTKRRHEATEYEIKRSAEILMSEYDSLPKQWRNAAQLYGMPRVKEMMKTTGRAEKAMARALGAGLDL